MSEPTKTKSLPSSESFEDRAAGAIKVWLAGAIDLVLKYKAKAITILILFAVGMGLTILRAVFLKLIPWAQRHFKLVTGIVDVFIAVFTTIENVIAVIIRIIKDIINLFSRHHKTLPPFHGHPYRFLSASTVDKDLGMIAATCPPLNSGARITRRALQHITQNNVCPMLRSLSVTPVFPLVNTTLGWMSLGTDPYLVSSCTIENDSYELFCMGLGTGLFIVEILLPVFLITFLLPCIAKSTWATYQALKKRDN